MFCPSCSAFMLESQLIKDNVKRTQDTELEYDAYCPFCKVRIGKMFWGKLEVADGLTSYDDLTYRLPMTDQQEPPMHEQQEPHGKGDAPPPDEVREEPYCEMETPAEPQSETERQPEADTSPKYNDYPKASPPPYPPPSYYYCPHCGQPLPEEKYRLPYKSGSGENA